MLFSFGFPFIKHFFFCSIWFDLMWHLISKRTNETNKFILMGIMDVFLGIFLRLLDIWVWELSIFFRKIYLDFVIGLELIRNVWFWIWIYLLDCILNGIISYNNVRWLIQNFTTRVNQKFSVFERFLKPKFFRLKL